MGKNKVTAKSRNWFSFVESWAEFKVVRSEIKKITYFWLKITSRGNARPKKCLKWGNNLPKVGLSWGWPKDCWIDWREKKGEAERVAGGTGTWKILLILRVISTERLTNLTRGGSHHLPHGLHLYFRQQTVAMSHSSTSPFPTRLYTVFVGTKRYSLPTTHKN